MDIYFLGIVRFVCCVLYVSYVFGDGGKCIGELEVLGLLLVLMCNVKFVFLFLFFLLIFSSKISFLHT